MASIQKTSIISQEAEHFGKLAVDWWDPDGSSAMLHRLNPVRLGYVREHIDRHFGTQSHDLQPLSGRKVLDIGCGAGLLCEPLARLGGAVTGMDAAEENIAVAIDHAVQSRLKIAYRHGGVEGLRARDFDLVTCMEVIEHVADPADFVAQIAKRLAVDGLLILSTPNRTPLSRTLLVDGAELVGLIPRGTHDWDKFLTPEELTDLLDANGLAVRDVRGIAFSPGRGLHLSDNMALNYIMAIAHKP